MAAVEQSARAIQNIIEEAAIGSPEAYGPFLRLLHEFHVVMTTPANGKNWQGPQRPFATRFEVEPAPPSASASSTSPASASSPSSIIVDGQEYVGDDR